MKVRFKKVPFLIFFCLLFFITLGYAYLTSNLNINGSTGINSSSWDIHFENVQVKDGSVSAEEPVIEDDTSVSFSVHLSKPGDCFEFDVDVVNDGSIDAMIDSIDSYLNDVEITELPTYLDYEVKYADGGSIAVNQLLKKQESDTLHIKIGYKLDINSSDLPSTPQSLDMRFSIIYVQAGSNAIDRHPLLWSIIRDNATTDEFIDFNYVNGTSNGNGIYYKNETINDNYPIYYYRGNITNNNVLFAGFCWQIVRTTDTGGVKLVYNGLPNNGVCSNTGSNTLIGSSKFNNNVSSLADVGYMYGDRYLAVAGNGQGWYYGPDVVYENGMYTLVDNYGEEVAIGGTGISINYTKHHYTCGSSTETSCENIKYLMNYSSVDDTTFNVAYYTLTGGKKIEDAVADMLYNSSNEYDSNIKSIIDNWYTENMIEYTSYLEDTIWCNDRQYENDYLYEATAFNPNGGGSWDNVEVYFEARWSKDLTCSNINDSFTVSSSNGNGDLTYPVGLLTASEFYLAGAAYSTANSSFYLHNETYTWTMTPFTYNIYGRGSVGQGAHVTFAHQTSRLWHPYGTDYIMGVRPAISLKEGTKIVTGNGDPTDPYIIKTN